MSKATQWLQNFTTMFLVVIFLTWGGMAIMALAWMLDDTPPFKMLNYSVTPAEPGSTMLVLANVERDLSRQCDAVYSRRFVDSQGVNFPLESDTSMGRGSLKMLDQRNPGKLVFSAKVPEGAAPGPGLLITPLTYTCNPWHVLNPITFSLEMDARVLAP